MNRMHLPRFLLTVLLFWIQSAGARDYSALVVEPETGKVLYEKYANELRHPASITKIMTLYLVFEALDRGELTLNTPFSVSRNAVLRPPSRLGLTPGETIAVEDAILALVTRSANDVATVIAENMGGSESAFADMMTAKAHSLGMLDTVFQNASGLPDPDQVTTAWDMYKLGKAMITNFPRYYPYFSTLRFYYRGQSFDNHNHLMETYPGMDGIKTGFINSSGFNLVASAKRGGRRIIGVVFGGPSAVRRDRHMRDILDDGFAQLEGAPPSYVEADFEKAPVETRGRLRAAELMEQDPPQITFGTPRRFRAGNNEPGSRYPSRELAPRGVKPASASPRVTPRRAPEPPRVGAPQKAPVTHPRPSARPSAEGKPAAKSAAPKPSPTQSSTTKSKLAAPVLGCRGGKDKHGKC